MAKIVISGVSYDQSNYTVHVVLTELQNVDDQEEETAIGEAFLRFPSTTEMPDIEAKIIDAARGIMKAHKNSLDKKRDIQELPFPPID